MSELGTDLIQGMENALAHAKGQEVPGARTTVVQVPDMDVRGIRDRLKMTQRSFAEAFGFSLTSVRNWEQGIRRPEKAARLLLAIIERYPDIVRETLSELADASAGPGLLPV